MTTRCPIPAPVVPAPIGPRSSTSTFSPARAHSAAQAAPTIPAPTIMRSCTGFMANAPAERVAFVQQQGAFGIDEGAARDPGKDFARGPIQPGEGAFEGAAQDAFLDPGFVFPQFSICRQAGQFGARAGAARRTVIGFARAQNEAARVGTLAPGRPEQLDVVDLGKPLGIDGLAQLPA